MSLREQKPSCIVTTLLTVYFFGFLWLCTQRDSGGGLETSDHRGQGDAGREAVMECYKFDVISSGFLNTLKV